jgi:cytochrome c oxidase cbb3-type subunit III
MSRQCILYSCALCAIALCAACNSSPGRPAQDSAVVPPEQVLNFGTLYEQNCAGCHGKNGKGGAAIALADPIFLAIAHDDVIRRTAVSGVHGTLMPAFAKTAGGMLTDQQINAIVGGIRAWARPELLQNTPPPPLSEQPLGDAHRGEAVYATYCASCHGQNGAGGEKASSIVNGSYLSLVSDQYLRIAVIAGRPELGAPDWRNDVPGRPMSSQEVADVVAWLSAQRPTFPNQPYLNSSTQRVAGEAP